MALGVAAEKFVWVRAQTPILGARGNPRMALWCVFGGERSNYLVTASHVSLQYLGAKLALEQKTLVGVLTTAIYKIRPPKNKEVQEIIRLSLAGLIDRI